MSNSGDATKASGPDAQGDGNKPETNDRAGATPPIERRFEEVIDRYLHETGQDNPPRADTELDTDPSAGPKSGRDNTLLRDASRRIRSHSTIYQRMRRNVRPSPYLFAIIVAALLSLLIWLGILLYAFGVDPNQPFAEFTLIRMQQALVLACSLSLLSSALLIRAAWQIWRGTRRYREFPPRRPALLRPPAILRGIDAERSGNLCVRLALVLVLLSVCLVVGTLSMILRYA